MTFELWWSDGYRSSDELECEWIAREAWDAATKAERERCREIVDERGRYADIAGMLDQIGE